MHNLIIWVLIITIVAVQAYVFKMTLNKIKIYKSILPNQENFKTVKVFIKETEIETVSLVNIFENPSEYSTIDQEKPIMFNDIDIEEIKEDSDEYVKYETVNDFEDFLYVEKDSVKTKIISKNLDFFISRGYKIINS